MESTTEATVETLCTYDTPHHMAHTQVQEVRSMLQACAQVQRRKLCMMWHISTGVPFALQWHAFSPSVAMATLCNGYKVSCMHMCEWNELRCLLDMHARLPAGCHGVCTNVGDTEESASN